MIEKLSVRNFKSWKDLPDMEFGKVTALFGANSSGKTSLIQLLLALKQTVDSRDRRIFNFGGDDRDYVDLGSYEDVIYKNRKRQDFGFSLTLIPSYQGLTISMFGKEWDSVQLSVTISESRGEVEVRELSYVAKEGIETGIDIHLSRSKTGQYFFKIESAEDTKEPPSEISAPQNFYTIPSFRLNRLSKSGRLLERESYNCQDLSEIVEREIEGIYYLGPLRDYPRREYRWRGERPSGVGIRGEQAVQTLLANLSSGEAGLGELGNRANYWLQRLGLVEEIELKPIGAGTRLYELKVRTKGSQHWSNLMDVGFGVSQVLPIVVLAHFASEGSLIILEQPEIHLHPNVQAELADLFLEVSLKRNVQFLIESHSEHLLNRLQKRMNEREGEFAQLADKDVRLYFCRREAEESVLEPVKTDIFGNIDNIPGEFYDPVTPLIGTLKIEGANGTTDLSERHDYYVTGELSHQLRDKDDDTKPT